MTREQRLEQALRHVERELREGNPAIIDTVWLTGPNTNGTLLDEVTMALERPSPEERGSEARCMTCKHRVGGLCAAARVAQIHIITGTHFCTDYAPAAPRPPEPGKCLACNGTGFRMYGGGPCANGCGGSGRAT